ncbi:hypothetical protein A2U01_0107051, partial [Trifolium medium]|nr:hypothetical protein [Trifolium medium]
MKLDPKFEVAGKSKEFVANLFKAEPVDLDSTRSTSNR